MARKFRIKRSIKIRKILFLLVLCISFLGIGYANINANLGIGGVLSFLGYSKTVTITLNNQNATIIGTTTIYEKYSRGYYLDNTLENKMTTSNNSITVPEKSGYIFDGYYTETNGGGVEYIDKNGYLTSNADNTYFILNGTLYAKWKKLMAENINYDNSNTGANCTDVQCMIDTITDILIG